MKREAWEAMNTAILHNRNFGHQIISDAVVEALHEAGFVIVPHGTSNLDNIEKRQDSEQ